VRARGLTAAGHDLADARLRSNLWRCSVDEKQDAAKIDRLLQRFSETTARRADLVSEMKDLAAKTGEVREALGNPYFYSGGNYGRPENADESIARFTGYKSHEPALRLVRSLCDADRELRTVREQLRDFGVDVE
jgi:hypothetical protein